MPSIRPWRLPALALALFVASAAAPAAQFIRVLTGGTSGVYYPLGVALAKLFETGVPDSKPSVQSTKASVENLNLLQAGRGELAFTLGDSLAQAWNGNEQAGFRAPLDRLRTLAAIYPNYIQIVAARDSGIRTLADLRGKRLSVGAPKSGTELNARIVLGAAGLKYEDFAQVEYLPFGESVERMKNRQLDATLQSAGLGVASIRDLAQAMPIIVVAVPPELVAQIDDEAYRAATIPAGTYEGQTEAVPTVAIGNFLVTHADVPDEVVYAMTKSLFEHLDALAAAHAAGKAIRAETAATGSPVPLHPGAERYYREAGLLK